MRLIVLCILALHSGLLLAHDCDGPPYGDTPENYQSLMHAFESASSDAQLQSALLAQVQVILATACEAKFGGGDRTLFHKAGISDALIDADSTAVLTSAWFQAHNAHQPERNGPYVPFTCWQGNCQSTLNYVFATREACERYIRQVGLADESKPTYMHCFRRRPDWQP